MKALEMQKQFNSQYAKILRSHTKTRQAYEQLTYMLMSLNLQRLKEGLDPLYLPNLCRTYDAIHPIPKIGDTVEYEIEEYTDQTHTATHTVRCTAKVLDVFENGDIRTDRDGVRTRSEYTAIKKGVADSHPAPLSK